MNRRTYNQFCGLAVALDRIGDRWTMLILRELVAGPARFSELQAGLPGIAPNLLSARLRRLEADGIVERKRLPPPASVDTYALTDRGCELEPALQALGRWGAAYLPQTPFVEPGTVRGIALAAKTLLEGKPLPDEPIVVDFDFGDERVMTMDLTPDRAEVHLGPDRRAQATVRLEFREFLMFALGVLRATDEPQRLDGDPEAVRRLEAVFAPAASG